VNDRAVGRVVSWSLDQFVLDAFTFTIVFLRAATCIYRILSSRRLVVYPHPYLTQL
jgi:hypothetical protein